MLNALTRLKRELGSAVRMPLGLGWMERQPENLALASGNWMELPCDSGFQSTLLLCSLASSQGKSSWLPLCPSEPQTVMLSSIFNLVSASNINMLHHGCCASFLPPWFLQLHRKPMLDWSSTSYVRLAVYCVALWATCNTLHYSSIYFSYLCFISICIVSLCNTLVHITGSQFIHQAHPTRPLEVGLSLGVLRCDHLGW